MASAPSARDPRRGVLPLTEDRLQFDGPRATYGRFRVVHQIGAGSVGPVFRGEDGETREPAVIKAIRVGLPPERVAIVAAALATLKERLPSHPALAGLIDTGVVDVEPYVVSPFIDGDSLDVALREFGPAHMSDALPRLRDIADAMDAAAAVGVAHGSLHLRDIVVSVDQTVVTGMGIAAVLERVGVRPPVRRPYCAPEVALGRGISPAADQYALAAIAHEWLSGRRLAGNGVAGLQALQVPALSEAAGDALRAVFARALDEAADARFPTATAFVEAIDALSLHAAPRARSSRRVPVVEAPRLVFDEPGETAASALDDFVPVPEPDPADEMLESAAADDPLDAPLVADAAAGEEWDQDVAAPDRSPAYGSVEFDEGDAQAPSLRDQWSTESNDDAPLVQEAEPAGDQAGGARPSWGGWVLVLALATASALTGGWLLLRWGTPAPAPELTAAATPASTIPPPAANADPVPMAGAPVEPAPSSASPPDRPATLPRQAEAVVPPVTAARPPAAVTRTPVSPTPPRPAPRASEPAAVTGGRVLVRTTPGGAEVFVNGERRGVTPLALRDLPFGAYTVRVVRAGFTPVEQRVAIEAGRPARSIEIALTRAGSPAPASASPTSASAVSSGSLLVDSRPAGARVLVDGRDVGVTPVTVADLAAGAHTVRIDRPGYQSITTTTRVEAGQRARVAVTLTAERPR